jgi:ribosome biogenesis GTPase
MQRATVVKSTGMWYEIRDESGKVIKARLRGKIRLLGLKVTNPVAVGDIVSFEYDKDGDGIVSITEISERKNYMIRSATQKKAHGHILAANIEHALLTATLAFPRTSLGFIDRFLVSAETFRIPASIVFNKSDLLDEEELAYQEALANMYRSLGYTVFTLCATEDDLSEISGFLQGKVTFIAGHSGVGKSTLINRLIPSAAQKTSEISDFSNKGVHTTTFAEMFEMSENTYLIDTPGIKELGLWQIGEEELSHYFPELRKMLGDCKFYNCTHTHEPNCAVKKAVEAGKIALTRYESYRSMFDNEDNRK